MSTISSPKKPKAPTVLRFSSVPGKRPADEIIAQIRASLSAEELRAGDRLPPERELAAQFGVSRNSVRQALHSLAELGLLQIRKGAAGGAFIHDGGSGAISAGISDMYTLGTIQPGHLTEVRVLLGTEVARLACKRCTPKDVIALEANVKLAEELADTLDLHRRAQVNLEFHRLLARMTRNPILIALTDAVALVIERFAEKFGFAPNQLIIPFRRRMLLHLRDRNANAAVEEMKNNLLRLEKFYLNSAS